MFDPHVSAVGIKTNETYIRNFFFRFLNMGGVSSPVADVSHGVEGQLPTAS